ncbi:helix-turn-helix domain-containing protein [Nocardia terpenica]|uniref:Helix-turn-helix domain-containing protein n=1 Tax=Nocardia terpenica TaxID=455432 RepID=A0A6G9Z6T9_9NOCA|nr:helix-turn-helix transcriptional regulator [Nocardia terpenica]QIS21238.1 helix-turn-helix domain-containing protein [Nocardia terpenica]
MADNSVNSETVARRQLSRELRKLRLESGISAEDAAEELGISLSTMSRIENGKTNVDVAHAKTMCNLYGRPELGDALAALAKASKTRSWFRQYSDVIPEWFDVYIGLEQVAASFRWYEAQLIPGILQTETYARTVIRTDHPDDSDDEIDRRVQLRLKRQALLTRQASLPQWHIILDEAVLHRPVGGESVMREQCNRLLEVAELPNVTLGVIPFGFGMHTGVTSGPFVLLDFPTNGSNGQAPEPTTVYVEGFTGALYTVEKNEVDKYRAAFEGMQRAALNPGDTKIAIARAVKEMKKK